MRIRRRFAEDVREDVKSPFSFDNDSPVALCFDVTIKQASPLFLHAALHLGLLFLMAFNNELCL